MGLFSKKKPKAVKATSSVTKNKSFYLRENQLTTAKDFNKLFDINVEDEASKYNINTEINFSNIPFSEITPEKTVEELDAPSFVLDNTEEVPGHIIYYYRQKADIINLLIQIHFIEDKCVYINNKISASGIVIANEDKKKILNKLFKKYKIKIDETENNVILLIDPFGNKLYTTDSVHFYLNYVVNNKILKEIKNILENNKPIDEAKDELDETLDKFI